MNQDDTQQALIYIDKALELKDCIKPIYFSWLLITKAKCLIKLSRSKEAQSVAEEALKLAESLAKPDLIAECHLTLTEIIRGEIEGLMKG